jgi:hypothetical protein
MPYFSYLTVNPSSRPARKTHTQYGAACSSRAGSDALADQRIMSTIATYETPQK